jgi:integrase
LDVGLDVGLETGPTKRSLLTDLRAKAISPGDKPVADGTIAGLRLEPGRERGSGKWTMRFVSPVTGRRRDMGLGPYPLITLAAARAKALEARRLILDGKDPIDERTASRAARRAAEAALSFEQAARKVHETLKPGWKNPKHVDQWINTLKAFAFDKIGKRKVAELTVNDFADVLRPIWLKKPETASRLKQRCMTIMTWCTAQGLVKGNPVDGVAHLLPQQDGARKRETHQPAMPWGEVPAFVRSLRGGPANTTRALLEFVILTAARSGEARAMTWGEVDLKAHVWTVPAGRMKARLTHRVPLSDRAVEILKAQRERHPQSDLVFPSPRGLVLSDMALTKFLRDCKATSSEPGRTATAHGFRSSFRDWASEHGFARDLAERALAHTVKNAVEAAYHRTDLLEQRRAMMTAWERHVGGQTPTSNVHEMRRRESA